MGSAAVARSASTAFIKKRVLNHKHLVCEIKVGLLVRGHLLVPDRRLKALELDTVSGVGFKGRRF